MRPFKLVRYVPDPAGGEYIPVETFVSTPEMLASELTTMMRGKPTFIELVDSREHFLNMGVGGSVGCVAFATPELIREGRTRNADGNVGDEIPEWVEFEIGGTPTPTNREWLLYPADVLAIAKYFLETGELHPGYSWS